jgi:hypothetical protein
MTEAIVPVTVNADRNDLRFTAGLPETSVRSPRVGRRSGAAPLGDRCAGLLAAVAAARGSG